MKEAYIRFMAPVTSQTSDSLIRIVDDKIRNGYNKIHLMISSPGGSVFHGLSLYNFLYGIPLEVDTYNFGSVDSIGVILFCAGKNRYSVPNARFLIHGVSYQGQGVVTYDEKMLDEHLKSLQIDQTNIAKIIAFTTGKSEDDIKLAMHDRTTFSPDQAKEYGLVTEINAMLMPANAEFHTIGEFDHVQTQHSVPYVMVPQYHSTPQAVRISTPKTEGFTSIYDRGYTFTDMFDRGYTFTNSLR